MKKNLTIKGSNKFKPEALFFEKQGDRAKNRLRPAYRWLVDWEGKYFCDQHGNIYSACQTAIRLKAQHENTAGYLRWTITGGKQKMVAREMLRAWKGECPPQHECAHMDDVKNNNSITNLRWAKRGKQGDLKRIMDGTATHELYTNGSNRFDAEWNRAMKKQWGTIQSHPAECSCSICELKHLPEAIPLSFRKKSKKAIASPQEARTTESQSILPLHT